MDAAHFEINLPGPEENNLIEYYISYSNEIEYLRQNLQQYYNFDMSLNDFKMYILKHLMMRMERKLIKEAIDKYKVTVSSNNNNSKIMNLSSL